MLKDYVHHLGRFPTAAKLFLAGEFLAGIGMGTIWVLRNLYLKQLGYDEGFIGKALSVSALGIVVAVPLSFIMDRGALKGYLAAGALAVSAGIAGTALWPTEASILMWGFIAGSGSALLSVGSVPFYMRVATPEERPFLFGLGTALSPASVLAGTAIVWMMAGAWGEGADGMKKMMLLSGGIAGGGAVLFLLIREKAAPRPEHDPLAADLGVVFRLGLPLVIIGFGAGLTIPFINLYFKSRFDLGPSAISLVYSVAQVYTFIAFLAAPLLGRRFGGVRTVVACQMLSIPFFLAMAFTGSPGIAIAAFLGRHALMNMAGPVNSQFAMEVVPAHKRALTNGLREIGWNGAFLVGTTAGGWMISRRLLRDGYTATMLATIALYIAGSVLFYVFWRKSTALKPAAEAAVAEPAEVAP